MTASEKNISGSAAVAQSIAAKLAIIVLNAATGILTARTLAPHGRGELATLILWPIFLSSAFTFGLPSALTFQLRREHASRHHANHSSILAAALILCAVASSLAMLIGFIFLPVWIPQYGPSTIFWARFFLLNTPASMLALVGRAALESRSNFAASNQLLVASPLATLIVLIVLAFTHTLTPLSAAFAYVAVGIIPTVWLLAQLWRDFSPSFRNLRVSAQLLLSYGIRSYGIDLCGAMSLYVDQALVIRTLSPDLMGIYVVALSLSRMLNAFHTSVIMVLFPRAVSRSPLEVAELTSVSTRISTLLTAAAGLIIILFGPQVLTLLYGQQYRGATPVLRVLVVEVVLAGATTVLSQAFMALERPGLITVLQVTGLLLTVPLLLLLTPRYNLLGAGLALLISTSIRFLSVMLGFPLFLKLPIPRVLPKREDFTMLFSMANSMSKRFRSA